MQSSLSTQVANLASGTSSRCPVCNSSKARGTETDLCTVSRCLSCGHEYTDPQSIKNPEVYTDSYFEDAHKNWFAHPHVDLFKLLESVVSKELGRKSRSARILDLGCGKCALLNYFSEVGYQSLTGIDICQPPTNAKEGIKFIRTSIEDFDDHERFDVILSTLAIEHVEKPSLMLSKIRKALDPGGIAVIVTNDVKTPLYIAAKLLRLMGIKEPYERLYHPHHLNHLSQQSLSRMAMENGLTLLDIYGLDVPFAALDIPSRSRLGKLAKGAGVRALFSLGQLTRHRFLQIQVLEG